MIKIQTISISDISSVISVFVLVVTTIINPIVYFKNKNKLQQEKHDSLLREQRNYWFKTFILDEHIKDIILFFEESPNLYDRYPNRLEMRKEYDKIIFPIKNMLLIKIQIFDKSLQIELKRLLNEYETNFFKKSVSAIKSKEFELKFLEILYEQNCKITHKN